MKSFTALARIEWVLLLSVTFPIEVYGPVLCLSDPSCEIAPVLERSVIGLTLLFIGVSALALATDRMFGSGLAQLRPIRRNVALKLEAILKEEGINLPISILGRCRTVPSDLTIGAHVRGVFFPYIVLSGGLVVGLIKRDRRALNVLAHELAHIRNLDQFLPGVIGLTVLQIVGTALILITQSESGTSELLVAVGMSILQAGILAAILSSISRYREFFADAGAVMLLDADSYYALLQEASGKERKQGGFFHPPLSARIEQVENNFRILRRGVFWRFYWPLNFLTSWLQWSLLRFWGEQPSHSIEYFRCAILGSLIGMVFTLVRARFAPATKVAASKKGKRSNADV